MEAALLLGLLGYGVHQYLGHDDKSEQTPQAVYSSQTTEEIANFGTNDVSLAQIDWSKAGNSIIGDSPETGVQWVFVTGN
tara:strand:+ start:265 stop:504 length:240 start_codon:yes stop_codon:yes gene_type:complete